MKSASWIPIKLSSFDTLAMPRGVPAAAAKIIIMSVALATQEQSTNGNAHGENQVANRAEFQNHLVNGAQFLLVLMVQGLRRHSLISRETFRTDIEKMDYSQMNNG